MADTKLSALTALTAIATGDLVEVLDISDTSMSAQGTNKKITRANLLNIGTDVFTQRTITGTTNQVTVTNGDGVSGNPTLSLQANLGAIGGLTTAASKMTKWTGSGTATTVDWIDWTTYSVTFGNITQGAGGTLTGRYSQMGKTVTFQAIFTLGTGSAVTGALTVAPPVTANTLQGTSTNRAQAWVSYLDSSASTTYYGAADWTSTTALNLRVNTVSGSQIIRANANGTVPFTWATGDEVYVFGVYEAA